jgi:hypothetical protein
LGCGCQRVFGYSVEEMIGPSILKRRIEHFETVRVTKSGNLLDVSLIGSAIKDEGGAECRLFEFQF